MSRFTELREWLVENEFEFRLMIPVKSWRALMDGIMHGSCVDVHTYRLTRHSILTRRVGTVRSFNRFRSRDLTALDYVRNLDTNADAYRMFDEFKMNLCSHTVYVYDGDSTHESNVQWPRVLTLKSSLEIHVVTFSRDVIEFLEMDASDANLGLLHIQKFCTTINDVRIALYARMNEFSEVSYEVSLECERSDSESFAALSSVFVKHVEPFLDKSIPLMRTSLDPLLVNKNDHFIRVVSTDSDISKAPSLLGYKAKLDGERLYATWDGVSKLRLSDNDYVELDDDAARSALGVDYVYQIERITSDGANYYSITEINAVRNYYIACQNSLVNGFSQNDCMRRKFRAEQVFPYGLVGLGIRDDDMRRIETYIEQRKTCANRDCSFQRTMVPIGILHSNAYLEKCSSLLKHRIHVNTLQHSITDIATSLPTDGYLALIRGSNQQNKCTFSTWFDDRFNYYVKLKRRQSVELRYARHSRSLRRALLCRDGLYFVASSCGLRWLRYDNCNVTIHGLFDSYVGKIVELSRISSTEFVCLRARTDKLYADHYDKTDSIVFDRGFFEDAEECTGSYSPSVEESSPQQTDDDDDDDNGSEVADD